MASTQREEKTPEKQATIAVQLQMEVAAKQAIIDAQTAQLAAKDQEIQRLTKWAQRAAQDKREKEEEINAMADKIREMKELHGCLVQQAQTVQVEDKAIKSQLNRDRAQWMLLRECWDKYQSVEKGDYDGRSSSCESKEETGEVTPPYLSPDTQSRAAATALLLLAQTDTPGKQRDASNINDQIVKTNLSEADALRWSARKRAKPERYDAANHQAAGSQDDAQGAKIATAVLKLEEYLGSPKTSTEDTRRKIEVPMKQVPRHRPSAAAKEVNSGVWMTLCISRSCRCRMADGVRCRPHRREKKERLPARRSRSARAS